LIAFTKGQGREGDGRRVKEYSDLVAEAESMENIAAQDPVPRQQPSKKKGEGPEEILHSHCKGFTVRERGGLILG